MIIFILILMLLMLYQIKICKVNEYHNDYVAPRQTANINAIFTILIFLSHSVQYVDIGGPLDEPYIWLKKVLGQLVVATFLFYSGFGIMQSISKKGMNYVKTIPTKRLFKVWYHFAIALVLFIIINLIFNIDYSLKQTLLSFTGYLSIGNSNWYMFITFVMYLIVFFAFMIAKDNKVAGTIITLVATVLFVIFEIKVGLPTRYYNTILCYPAGMIFSLIKPYFDKFLMKNDVIWVSSILTSLGLFYYFYRTRTDSNIHYNIFAILLVITVMMFNMKVKIENIIFDWIGKHIFSIFFLQRLPMNIYEALGLKVNSYLFVIVSFIITIIIAVLFDKAMDKLDSLIYSNKQKKAIKEA